FLLQICNGRDGRLVSFLLCYHRRAIVRHAHAIPANSHANRPAAQRLGRVVSFVSRVGARPVSEAGIWSPGGHSTHSDQLQRKSSLVNLFGMVGVAGFEPTTPSPPD